MPSAEEFKNQPAGFIVMLNGHYKVGKTTQALTFPKCYVISCDPAGVESIRGTPEEDNLVHVEYILSENRVELGELFRRCDKPAYTEEERKSVYGCLAHAKKLIAEGLVETVILDGFTYFTDYKVSQVWEHDQIKNAQNELDTQSMWGRVAAHLQTFVLSDFLPMACRQNVNVIITCHVQRLSEEQRLGPDDDGASKKQAQQNRKKKRSVVLNSDLAPRIAGGLRDKIDGMIRATIYLDKRLDTARGIVYEAIADICPGYGTIVPAGNSYGMVPKIDITNGSLWDELQAPQIAKRRAEWEKKAQEVAKGGVK